VPIAGDAHDNPVAALDSDQKPDGLQVNAGLRKKSLGCAHALR
jgi:hypothetical protein